MTRCRNTCNSGCVDGSCVTSKSGLKTSVRTSSALAFTYSGGDRTADDVLERLYRTAGFVYIVQPRDLYEPPHVVREELVVYDPFGELVPFGGGAAVDGDAPFAVLVFGCFGVFYELCWRGVNE